MESIEELAIPSNEANPINYDLFKEAATRAAIGAVVGFGVTMALHSIQERVMRKRLEKKAANKITPDSNTED